MGRAGQEGGQKFTLAYVDYEMSITPPSGDVRAGSQLLRGQAININCESSTYASYLKL